MVTQPSVKVSGQHGRNIIGGFEKSHVRGILKASFDIHYQVPCHPFDAFAEEKCHTDHIPSSFMQHVELPVL